MDLCDSNVFIPKLVKLSNNAFNAFNVVTKTFLEIVLILLDNINTFKLKT